MNEIEKMKAESVHTIIRGIIATEMGYANQTHVCNSAKSVFEYIGSINQTEFRNVKKFLNTEKLKQGTNSTEASH